MHTKGPWEISRSSDPEGGLWIESDGAAITHLSKELEECGSPIEANARLIVEAPRMLKALEDCHILIAMIAKDNPSKVCLNKNGWKSAKLLAEEVTEAIRKAKELT